MDWKTLISDLINSAGMTQKEIADQVGLSQPSINDLLHGRAKSVRWEHGENLRKLHAEIVRAPALTSPAPTIDREAA